MRTSFVLTLLVLPFYIISQTKTFELNYGTGKQTPLNLKTLKDSVTSWQNNAALSILSITGYADNVGSEKSNLALSLNRAQTAEAILKQEGILRDPASIAAYGEEQASYTNDTKLGRSKNRRVKIIFRQTITPPAAPQVAQTPTPQCNERDTIIILPGGTEIEIKGCSLEGLSLKDIHVSAEEYFTKDKMIDKDMFTQTTDGSCLRTGGMLSLRITDAYGKPIQLKADAALTIRIPKIGNDTTFNMYGLVKDSNNENAGWDKRSEAVTYLPEKQKFEVKMKALDIAMNLDFLPAPVKGFFPKQVVLKTRGIRKGRAYISGDASVLKLARIKPQRFKFKTCACIPADQQYVTAYARKNGKVYYCHKKLSELKQRKLLRRFIVRRSDYLVLENKALRPQLKKDLAAK